MCLCAKMQRRTKIGEQQLSIESDQQIARLDILVNESFQMHIMERIGCLFHISDMRSPYQEIATLTADGTIRVIMSPNRVCVETVGHVWNPTSSLEILYLIYLRLCQLWVTDLVDEVNPLLYHAPA